MTANQGGPTAASVGFCDQNIDAAIRRVPGIRQASGTLATSVVVAADDPSTAEFQDRHRDWQLLAEHVDLHEVADGGHYFVRTRPAEAAKAVLSAPS